jgi:hypothetical protein
MNDVINLSSYLRTGVSGANTTTPSSPEVRWDVQEGAQSRGSLAAAAVVLRLEPETDLSKFLARASDVIRSMEQIEAGLATRDIIGADDCLLASKEGLSELLMYRDISDGLGLIVLKCFQAVTAIVAVTDAPNLAGVIKHELQRTWAAPFIDFDDACAIADVIEETAGSMVLPGYNELAAELLGDAAVSEVQIKA